MAEQTIKGRAVRLFHGQPQGVAALSPDAVDCTGFNALSIEIIGQGLTTVTLAVQGAESEGGIYATLPDPNATQTAVTSSKIFDVVMGQTFAKVNITSITGSVVIIATPYIAAGQTSISVTNTASQNLAQVGGATIAEGQATMAASLPVVIASNQSAVPGSVADGSDVAVGATADAIVAAGATGTLSAKLRRVTQGLEDLKTLIVLAAGSAIIGKVGIDQTTPGTTNRVDVGAALPAGTNLLGKVGIDQTTPGTTNRVDVGAALPAGSAIIGKVGIDQTTPGTTNLVDTELPAAAALGDGAANPTAPAVGAHGKGRVSGGTTWDDLRTVGTGGGTNPGVLAATRPLDSFAIQHTPAVNTAATITQAAGAAGVKHVCTSITATLAAGATAPAAVQTVVVLRDGATGVGTIKWSASLSIQAVAGGMSGVAVSGLQIVGSAATAMTLEFTGAGGANTFEQVSLTGFDITA